MTTIALLRTSVSRWADGHRSRFGILPAIGLFLTLVGTGCGGSDDPASPSVDPMADVNAYVAGLTAWPTPLPSSEDPTGGAVMGTETVGSTDYDCVTTPYSITQTPEKIVVFDPDDEIFWLGSLLQGDGYRGGIGSLSELPIRQRAPMDIWIDILGEGTTRRINSPSPTEVNAAIGELVTLAEGTGQTFASEIFFSQTTSHSVDQSALKMGLSAHYLGGKARADLDYSRDASQNTVTAYFLQKMFTTSMTLPQLPGDLFSSAFTEERLQEQVDLGRIGPDNQPAYISSIVWGRLMMLTLTSTRTVSEINAALSASYEAAGAGGSGSVSAAQRQLLSESSIKLVTLGGDAESALGYLRTGALGEFFAQDSPLTSAVPLSFTVRDMQSNEKALVSETTSYNVKTCSPVAAAPIGESYRTRLTTLRFANTDCDGAFDSDLEAYWDIRINNDAVYTTTRSSGNPLTANSGQLHSITTQWAQSDLLFDGTGTITISGSLSDYDASSANDLIASWNLSYNISNVTTGNFEVKGTPGDSSCSVYLNFTIERIGDVYPRPPGFLEGLRVPSMRAQGGSW